MLPASGAAWAQQWTFDAGIASQLTWTSNATLGSSTGEETDDTVIDLRPRFAIRREGARLRVGGFAELSGTTHLNGRLPSRLLPTADLSANLEAVERWLYLEAGARALQTRQDPFGPEADSAVAANTLTTTQFRLSPYIESSPLPNWRYRLRSDNVRTSEAGSTFGVTASDASGYFGRHTLAIERDPRPFGGRLEAERSETRYDDTDERLIIDLVRLSTDYAFSDEFSAGVRAGYERNSFTSADDKGAFYGVQASWRPSERTSLSAFRETRFFGTGWRLGFDHRTPQMAWNIALQKGTDTSPQSLFELPATDNVAALLDAAFTTRFPDPAERARVVQDFIAQRGLPSATRGATNIYARRLSLTTSRIASIALIGGRNTLALSGFSTRTQDATEVGPFATDLGANNNTQYGGALVFNHRPSATSALTVSLDWRRIRALESIAADRASEKGLRLLYNVQTAPRSNVFFGVRFRTLESNVAPDGDEGAVFVGLDQRF